MVCVRAVSNEHFPLHTQPCCQESVELHAAMFYRSHRWATSAYLHGLGADVHLHKTTCTFCFLSPSDGKSQRAGTSGVDYKRHRKSHKAHNDSFREKLTGMTITDNMDYGGGKKTYECIAIACSGWWKKGAFTLQGFYDKQRRNFELKTNESCARGGVRRLALSRSFVFIHKS